MATVQVRIGPADHGRRMTLEEFREADTEAGYRYELARGVVEVTEVPNDPHGQTISNLQWALYRYKTARPDLIRRIGGGSEFRLWIAEMDSGRNPDVAVVFRGTPKNERGRRPPRFVAEVVSARGENRDYREKREEYLKYGLLEYWIVDPSLRRVTVLVRREGDGEAAWGETVFHAAEMIVGELMPDLGLSVADLWVDADLDEIDGD